MGGHGPGMWNGWARTGAVEWVDMGKGCVMGGHGLGL
jgi:hypothetical protein